MNWPRFLRELLNIADKYYVIAGLAFLLFYVLLRRRVGWKKIQPKFPTRSDYRREILYSTISIVIFSLPPLVLLQNDRLRPHTTYYAEIPLHGWGYFFAAFPLMLLIHDTYFYWMHRMIHHPKLFRLFHLVHHRSVNPSPWAAYAFHPLEAFLESLIFVIFLFTLPINGWHLFVFFVISLLYNVYGHLGFELYPKGFSRHWLGRWVNTSVSHNLHHHYFKGNYGLYFLFWDRAMGTLRADYDKAFAEVGARATGEVSAGAVSTGKAGGGGASAGAIGGSGVVGKVSAGAVVGKAMLVLGLCLAGTAVQGQVKADDIAGVWLTHGDKPAKIQIYRSGDQFTGKIVFLQFPAENGKPRVDHNNPEKGLRDRPLLGLSLLSGFRFDKDEWNDGKIYDPQSGKTYSCTMSLKDPNTLRVRGFVGISLLGRTEVWTRTTAP